MKKLDALIVGFADEVFRTIRGATLGELAELLGTAGRSVAPEPSVARLAVGRRRHRPDLSPSRRSGATGSSRASRASDAELDELEPPNAQAVVAEITDPERLLGLDADAPSSPAHAHQEQSPEPPPVSTEKPVSFAPVLLRANEALVRASGAGIVIRRRKNA